MSGVQTVVQKASLKALTAVLLQTQLFRDAAPFIHSFIHEYSALEAGLAGTRAQSCDRYGSGTLHPGHVLGGSLPLLSPHL